MPRCPKNVCLICLSIFTLFAGSSLAFGQDPAGGIRGVVVDADFSDPVREAVVMVLETNARQETGTDGHFLFENLPPGAYTISVSKAGYQRLIKARVVVTPGALEDLKLELQGEFMEMEEMVVRDIQIADTTSEAGLLELRKTELSFQDSVSRDLMSKAGASDAAGALKLVVGASVADGKYATVRGLSDRYVGAAVNSIRVPSADPKKRSVHMDIFPAGTIESLSVSKTFTPDLPGDYTGGGVNIRTIALPEEDFLKVSYSRGIDALRNRKDGFVTYDGAGCGMWGRHLGERDMTPGMETMEAQGLNYPGTSYFNHLVSEGHQSDEQYQTYDRLTRGLSSAMGIQRMKQPTDYSISLSAGDTVDIGGGWAFGKTLAFSYSRKWDQTHYSSDDTYSIVEELNFTMATNPVFYMRDVGEEELKWSTLATLGLGKGKDHLISLTLLRNRVASDKASIATSTHPPIQNLRVNQDSWEQNQSINYTERSLDVLQLRGEHHWESIVGGNAGLELNWHVARNQTEQEEPDIRYFKNFVMKNAEDSYFYHWLLPGENLPISDFTRRVWRNTKEDNYIFGLDLAVPFKLDVPDPHAIFWGRGPGKTTQDGRIKVGWSRDRTHRTYIQNSFYYVLPTQDSPDQEAYGAPAGPYRTGLGGNQRYAYVDWFGVIHYNRRQNVLEDLYEADLQNYWFPSADGQKYLQAVEDHQQAAASRTFTSDRPDALWTDTFGYPDNVGAGAYSNNLLWTIDQFDGDVRYTGFQLFDAGYWMLELPVTRQLKLMGGARLELMEMTIDPRTDQGEFEVVRQQNGIRFIDSIPIEDGYVSLQTSTWLRALGVVYEPMENMFIRWNYGQTMARPTFRELAPMIQVDYIENELFIGNPELTVSRIENYDWRWEWFPKPGDVISFSLFRKELTDPIERISFGVSGQQYYQAYNFPYGEVEGYEFEFRKTLDFLPEPLSYLSLGFNFTDIDAIVWVPDEEKGPLSRKPFLHGQDTRAMEGQPTFLKNFNLSWDYPKWGTSASIFYNQTGEILKSGASLGRGSGNLATLTYDLFEAEKESWNFSLSQKIGAHLKLKFRAKNMLNPPRKDIYRDRRNGQEIVKKQYQEGPSYSLGLSAEW